VDQEPDYRSWLAVTADADAAWPYGPWQSASAVTDAVDTELAELRRRVVDPVVASVLTADELESVVVFEERMYHEVRATVVARGEASHHYLQMRRSLPAAEEELSRRAAQFASELEDFVAESGFAWGEQRIARYKVPPA
jgi:hypothetical protein